MVHFYVVWGEDAGLVFISLSLKFSLSLYLEPQKS